MVLVHDSLIVLYNCMTFHLKSFKGCQLTERTRNSIANDQREITPKICLTDVKATAAERHGRTC